MARRFESWSQAFDAPTTAERDGLIATVSARAARAEPQALRYQSSLGGTEQLARAYAIIRDDLNAAVGGVSGRRWQGFTAAPPRLSGERLSDVVEAPGELALRLAMVRVVDTDDGAMLDIGERLVTRDGRLRRWDGFAAEDDGAAAAEQLERANRLEALLEAIPVAENMVSQQGAALDALGERILTAQDQARQLASAQAASESALRQALRDADRAEDALTRLLQAATALSTGALARETVESQAEQDRHWFRQNIPCRTACPAGTDIPGDRKSVV